MKLPVAAGIGQVEMTAPSVEEAPPGYYMVFLVDDQGVPSIAPVVRLDASAGAVPQPRVTQSSQLARSAAAWNAFDGDSSQAPDSKFSRTTSEPEPWWQVDLGASRDLEDVTVRFRTDCCTAENRDLWVFASDTPFESTTVDGLRSQAGVTAVRLETPDGDSNAAALGRSARYIRVQSAATGSLALVEVTPNAPLPNLAPMVSITSPTSGSLFEAPADFRVYTDASDADGTVKKVEFYRGAELHKIDANPPFSAGVYGLGTGTHDFTAKAIDNEGAETTSAPVSVTVEEAPGNLAPMVSITSPTSGSLFEAPADFRVYTDASDADGTVKKVEFYRGAELHKIDANPPFSASVKELGVGTYDFTARAVDDRGAKTTSAPVSVTVEDPVANLPPSVLITSPATGTRFSGPASFRVFTDTSDADGTVKKVEYFRDSVLFKTDANPPFSAGVYDLGPGDYEFTARAIDDKGAKTISAPVSVTVDP